MLSLDANTLCYTINYNTKSQICAWYSQKSIGKKRVEKKTTTTDKARANAR